MLIGHGPNKAFLVPDSCRATERNGNNVSVDVTEDTIETSLWQFGRCFGLFDIAR